MSSSPSLPFFVVAGPTIVFHHRRRRPTVHVRVVHGCGDERFRSNRIRVVFFSSTRCAGRKPAIDCVGAGGRRQFTSSRTRTPALSIHLGVGLDGLGFHRKWLPPQPPRQVSTNSGIVQWFFHTSGQRHLRPAKRSFDTAGRIPTRFTLHIDRHAV